MQSSADTGPLIKWLQQLDFVVSSYIGGSWTKKDGNLTKLRAKELGTDICVAARSENIDVPATPSTWTDIGSRRKRFEELHAQYSKPDNLSAATILESLSTKSTVKAARNRLELHFISLLSFMKDDGWLRDPVIPLVAAKQLVVITDGESFLDTIAKAVIPSLGSGHSVQIAFRLQSSENVEYSVLLVTHFVQMCHAADFPANVVNFVITQDINPQRSIPVKAQIILAVLVLENSDLHSVVESVLEIFVNSTRRQAVIVFVHQNLAAKFVRRFEFLKKTFILGSNFLDESINMLDDFEVDLEAIDPTGVQNKNLLQLNMYKFRSTEELLKLATYFPRVDHASIWCENSSFAIEVAQTLKNCPSVSINASTASGEMYFNLADNIAWSGTGNYPQLDTAKMSAVERAVDKALQSSKSFGLLSVAKRFKKLAAVFTDLPVSIEDVLRLVRSYLEATQSTSDQIVLKKRAPIGVVGLILEDEEALSTYSSFILVSLLTGNSLVVFDARTNKELQMVKTLEHCITENCIQILDKSLVQKYAPKGDLSLFIHRSAIIGSLLRSSCVPSLLEQLPSALSLLTRSQTIWMPAKGFINYAK